MIIGAILIFGMPILYANGMPPPLFTDEEIEEYENCQRAIIIPQLYAHIKSETKKLPDNFCYIIIEYFHKPDLRTAFCKVQVGQFTYGDIRAMMPNIDKTPTYCNVISEKTKNGQEVFFSPRSQMKLGMEPIDICKLTNLNFTKSCPQIRFMKIFNYNIAKIIR